MGGHGWGPRAQPPVGKRGGLHSLVAKSFTVFQRAESVCVRGRVRGGSDHTRSRSEVNAVFTVCEGRGQSDPLASSLSCPDSPPCQSLRSCDLLCQWMCMSGRAGWEACGASVCLPRSCPAKTCSSSVSDSVPRARKGPEDMCPWDPVEVAGQSSTSCEQVVVSAGMPARESTVLSNSP